MKNIVLIGDSIRMGYDKYVKEALAGVANVYYPPENCRFAEYVLRYAHEWKKNGEWPTDVDLVHWNAGLWDALMLFDDEPLTTLDYYENAIARIDKRLRMLFPNAKFIFATSTAVIENKFAKNFKRDNRVIQKYNETAKRALANTDTIINDLFALTSNCPESYHSDAVHYRTPEGTEVIGGRVLALICRELGISAKDVDIENFEPEKYTADNIGF